MFEGAFLELISLNSKKVFTKEQAEELLPLIFHFTEKSQLAVKNFSNQIKSLRGVDSEKVLELENSLQGEIEKWNQKMKRLGTNPKGVWLADFDSGQGYFCWKYPETKIQFWHGYEEGFTRRIEL